MESNLARAILALVILAAAIVVYAVVSGHSGSIIKNFIDHI